MKMPPIVIRHRAQPALDVAASLDELIRVVNALRSR